MSKYIDVEQTEKIANGLFIGTVGITFSQAVHALLEAVEPADVAPVVHAHRGVHVGDMYRCSHCSKIVHCSNYCENCGAKMDGEPCVKE